MKQIKEQLLNQLAVKLQDHGFKYRSSRQHFVKKFTDGKLSFHISMNTYKSHSYFDVAADVGIRFEKVENAKNENSKYLSAKDKKETFTLGNQLANIENIGIQRWSFYTMDDVDSNVQSIYSAFQNTAEPFFAKYSDLNKVIIALKEDGDEAELICPFADRRAEIVKIIEKLYDL